MIPKTIHQIWIGDRPIPKNVWDGMQTWKNKNPEFKHYIWNNQNIQTLIETMPMKHLYKQYGHENKNVWNGRANLLRYEILYRYGGIYIDADSYCLKPLDKRFTNIDFWAAYEHEKNRPGLINNAFLGSACNHPVLEKIREKLAGEPKVVQPSWRFSGPELITETIRLFYPLAKIWPSYTFSPRHARNDERYTGDGEVFAEHTWGNSEKSYVFEYEKVYGIMITGLPGREKMAKLALDNWHEQNYNDKYLLIVNDGSYRFGNDNNVTEINIRPGKTLGELRNVGQYVVPNDGVIIQWDDDDYRHPTLIEKQYNQFTNTGSRFMTLKKQTRYCFDINSAWIMEGAKKGIHGTPMYRKTEVKYPSERISEDTIFLNDFRHAGYRCTTWNNEPHLYLRFIHGKNTWDDAHFKLHTRKQNYHQVAPEHAEWFNNVIKKYKEVIQW